MTSYRVLRRGDYYCVQRRFLFFWWYDVAESREDGTMHFPKFSSKNQAITHANILRRQEDEESVYEI